VARIRKSVEQFKEFLRNRAECLRLTIQRTLELAMKEACLNAAGVFAAMSSATLIMAGVLVVAL
jgi:hypothetical protein